MTITNEEKLIILNNKIQNIQDIYDANLINIENADYTITSESDYGIEECYSLKQNLEKILDDLYKEKALLTNPE